MHTSEPQFRESNGTKSTLWTWSYSHLEVINTNSWTISPWKCMLVALSLRVSTFILIILIIQDILMLSLMLGNTLSNVNKISIISNWKPDILRRLAWTLVWRALAWLQRPSSVKRLLLLPSRSHLINVLQGPSPYRHFQRKFRLHQDGIQDSL